MQKQYCLSELLNLIKVGLKAVAPECYWVVAEIGEMNVNYSGHCYLELIERNEDDNLISAKIRATIWASQYRMLKQYFESVARHRFEKGLKVLVRVSVEFHQLYGLSLNVRDIDPTYTIGEQQRIKQQIIEQLKAEGVWDMNRRHKLPVVIERVAVISSETAAGLGDFMQHIESCGWDISCKLFAAVMQGEQASESVVDALDRVADEVDDFDVVVIIRGGGSQSDLACFDDYWLCFNITQFPLPVLTGIGHERDDSIADMVAHTRLKTPTAVADFIIGTWNDFSHRIEKDYERLYAAVDRFFESKRNLVERYYLSLDNLFHKQMNNKRLKVASMQNRLLAYKDSYYNRLQARVDEYYNRLPKALENVFIKEREKVQGLRNRLEVVSAKRFDCYQQKIDRLREKIVERDPQTYLKRGYTVTTDSKGIIVRSSKRLNEGEIMFTHFADGKVESKINRIENEDKE